MHIFSQLSLGVLQSQPFFRGLCAGSCFSWPLLLAGDSHAWCLNVCDVLETIRVSKPMHWSFKVVTSSGQYPSRTNYAHFSDQVRPNVDGTLHQAAAAAQESLPNIMLTLGIQCIVELGCCWIVQPGSSIRWGR